MAKDGTTTGSRITLTRFQDVEEECVVFVKEPLASSKLSVILIVWIPERSEAGFPKSEVQECPSRRLAIGRQPIRG